MPLSFSWAMTPLHETIEELLATDQAPVYVVHFTQAAAVEQAQALHAGTKSPRRARRRTRSPSASATFRFGAGFGRTLSRLVRARHRRAPRGDAAEVPPARRAARAGRPAQGHLRHRHPRRRHQRADPHRAVHRAVKYDGSRQRVLEAREFHQIAGRAGRAGFDTVGYVVVQAPEHVDRERAGPRQGRRRPEEAPQGRSARSRPRARSSWTEETFDRLVAGEPEPLASRMRVDHAMVLNVARPGASDAVPGAAPAARSTTTRTARTSAGWSAGRIAAAPARSRTPACVDPARRARRARPAHVAHRRPAADFALNQPLSPFALAALDMLDPESPTYALDVVSVIEATLDDPRQVLMAQQFKARGEAVGAMKADGIEYEERMELLEEVTWPQPLAELLERGVRDLPADATRGCPRTRCRPSRSCARCTSRAMTFAEFVAHYRLARSEGLVLRYLTDAYRALRQTVPEAHRTEELDDIVEWLGEVVRQTDSSLLDEWEALADPERRPAPSGTSAPPPAAAADHANKSGLLRVMVRNAMFRRVELAARDDVRALAALDAPTPSAPTRRPPVVDGGRLGRRARRLLRRARHRRHRPRARGPELLHVEVDRRRARDAPGGSGRSSTTPRATTTG